MINGDMPAQNEPKHKTGENPEKKTEKDAPSRKKYSPPKDAVAWNRIAKSRKGDKSTSTMQTDKSKPTRQANSIEGESQREKKTLKDKLAQQTYARPRDAAAWDKIKKSQKGDKATPVKPTDNVKSGQQLDATRRENEGEKKIEKDKVTRPFNLGTRDAAAWDRLRKIQKTDKSTAESKTASDRIPRENSVEKALRQIAQQEGRSINDDQIRMLQYLILLPDAVGQTDSRDLTDHIANILGQGGLAISRENIDFVQNAIKTEMSKPKEKREQVARKPGEPSNYEFTNLPITGREKAEASSERFNTFLQEHPGAESRYQWLTSRAASTVLESDENGWRLGGEAKGLKEKAADWAFEKAVEKVGEWLIGGEGSPQGAGGAVDIGLKALKLFSERNRQQLDNDRSPQAEKKKFNIKIALAASEVATAMAAEYRKAGSEVNPALDIKIFNEYQEFSKVYGEYSMYVALDQKLGGKREEPPLLRPR